MSEELRHNGRHALAFDRSWSVKRYVENVRNGKLHSKFTGTYAYNYGHDKPHYPVPALASSAMCIALNWYNQDDGLLAYDGLAPTKLDWV